MKSGIDYFPLDVTLDSKMELIEAEFGLAGFGVVVHLLQEIYGKAGYYIEWTTEVALLFAKKIGLGGGVVSEIVEASIRRGMFDQDIFDKYNVLTSRGIQKRYFEAVSRRKEIEVDYNILLVDVAHICKNADIRQRNVNILSENDDISKQSKVEKSKVEKSKEKKSTVYREIIDYLNLKAGTNYKANPKATQDHINGRLNEGFTVEDFKTVIDIKCAEWLGTDMAKFLRPGTLFAPKFEGYLNQRPKTGISAPAISTDNAGPSAGELERMKKMLNRINAEGGDD